MQNSDIILNHLLEYTKHRYDSSLKTMLDIGDINIDDVYELMKQTHEQLKELLMIVNVETNFKKCE